MPGAREFRIVKVPVASTEALQALNSPVNAVLAVGGIPGVGGMSNAPQSSSELFVRHPKKPKKR